MPNDADADKAQAVYERVKSGFGTVAAAYTTSLGDADASLIAPVVALAAPLPTDLALDIATGAGHTALAIARVCGRSSPSISPRKCSRRPRATQPLAGLPIW